MKEIVKTVIVFILLLLAIFVVIFTRGKGNLDFNVKFDSSSAQETFSYEIASSPYNGEFKNDKGNSMYIMVGANSNGTYRIYFIKVGAAIFGSDNKYPKLRLDDVKLDANNTYSFVTTNNVSLKLKINDNKTINVTSNMSLGDAEFEGTYNFKNNITRFDLRQFQI